MGDDPHSEITGPLLFLIGPTGSGKTDLSLRLAERIGGEIISADSRLFYRGMDIGTAKPSPRERSRVPHHLIDVVDPDQTFTLAQFQVAAIASVRSIQSRGRLAIVVGGTGQYIRALTQGWQLPQESHNPGLRKALEIWLAGLGANRALEGLRVLDPETAGRIDSRNPRRMVRAWEVILRTGRPMAEQRKRGKPIEPALLVGLSLPRPLLYQRLDARLEAMLAAGFLEEVASLNRRGYSDDAPALTAIGYRELGAHLRGETTFAEALVLIRRRTRTLVRRQANWFKPGDPDLHWFSGDPDPLDSILELIQDRGLWHN